MNILHVNTQDDAGGAARIAISLMKASRERGHDARMIVGFKGSSRPEVIELPRHRNAHIWTRACRRVGRALDRLDRRPGVWRLQRLLRTWGRTPRQRHLALGCEEILS